MVSKYPQKTPSPGTPIGISQLKVTVRAITNKRSTPIQIFCWAFIFDVKLDFGVHLYPRYLASTSMLENFKLQCWSWILEVKMNSKIKF